MNEIVFLNGMLHHSLATLEGEQDFIFFTELFYPETLPSLFICRDFFSFCPFHRVRACLQAQGLARETAICAGTLVKCKKREKFICLFDSFKVSSALSLSCDLSLFINLKEGVEVQLP